MSHLPFTLHVTVSPLVVAGVAAGLLQSVLAIWMIRAARELALVRERMSRLADGLALLTDTTESGLTTMTRAILQLSGQVTEPAESRNVIARRVLDAAREGTRVARIAAKESLSETEVVLHLRLAEAAARERPASQSA